MISCVRRSHRWLTAAAFTSLFVITAACGSDNTTAPNSTTPPASSVGVPAPIDLASLAASMVDSPCPDELVAGVKDIVGYQIIANDPTAAVPQATSKSSTTDGVPTCTFSIDWKGADLAPTVVIGALPADKNSIISDNLPLTSGKDLVAKAAESILAQSGENPPRDGNPSGEFNYSGNGEINLEGHYVNAAGVVAADTTPVTGFFVISQQPNNQQLTVSGPGGLIHTWLKFGTVDKTAFLTVH